MNDDHASAIIGWLLLFIGLAIGYLLPGFFLARVAWWISALWIGVGVFVFVCWIFGMSED